MRQEFVFAYSLSHSARKDKQQVISPLFLWKSGFFEGGIWIWKLSMAKR